MATSLGQIILFRAMQGLAGGGLQPSSQGILLDTFPPEKQGAAMTLFGIAALLAPVVGPTLGGWITVQYEWRWIFYINVPVGLLALAACCFLVEDPDYLKAETAAAARRKIGFDSIGLGLLVVAMASWEVMLSKGQEWDWLGDPFWRVQTLAAAFRGRLGGLIVWETRSNPIINFRPFLERNFAVSCIIIFCAYAVLLGREHFAARPAAIALRLRRPGLGPGAVARRHFADHGSADRRVPLGRGVDARWLIAAGLLVVAVANYLDVAE